MKLMKINVMCDVVRPSDQIRRGAVRQSNKVSRIFGYFILDLMSCRFFPILTFYSISIIYYFHFIVIIIIWIFCNHFFYFYFQLFHSKRNGNIFVAERCSLSFNKIRFAHLGFLLKNIYNMQNAYMFFICILP